MRLSETMGLRAFLLSALLCLVSGALPVVAESPRVMEIKAHETLEKLYRAVPTSKILAEKAKGILVFSEITKGGFMVGGQYGEGVLFKNNRLAGFYNTASASFGLQAGIQKYGYAMFFMNESDLRYLNSSDGWEVGVGPSVTIVDTGYATSLTTTTAREGVYAFIFEQKGLMAGMGLQGTKITQINPKA